MTTPPNAPGQGQPSGTFGQGGQNPDGHGPGGSGSYGQANPGVSGQPGQNQPGPRSVHGSGFPQPGFPQPGPAQPPFQPGQPGQQGFNYYAAQPGQPQARLRQGPQFGYGPGGPATPPSYRSNPKNAANAKRRRLIALVVVALLILGIGGYLGVNWFTSRNDERDAQAAMTGLLTALQAGDASTALSYLDVDSSLTDGQPLLTNDAIAGNPDSFSFNPSFVVTHSGGVFSQQASVQINGTTRVVEWDASEVDGSWKIDGSEVLGRAGLETGQSVQINGIPVGPGPLDLSVLPGSYTVASGLALLSYAPGQADFDIFTGGQTTIEADLIVADGVQQQVIDQVRGILNGCVAEKVSPGTCNWVLGFTNGHAVDGTIVWALSPDDPASQLTVPSSGWSASDAFSQTFPVRYQTTASGEGQLTDGSRATFDSYVLTRTSYFSLDLSGEAPVVKLVS